VSRNERFEADRLEACGTFIGAKETLEDDVAKASCGPIIGGQPCRRKIAA
jgi:hypothetical protein